MVFTLIVKIHANEKPESIPRLSAKLAEAAILYRKDKGTINWFVMQSTTDPREFSIVERFEDEASLKIHQENPYFATFAPYIGPLIDRELEIRYFNELDTSKDVKAPE